MLRVRVLLQQACLYPWARCLISIALLTRAYLGPVVCGECYNLSADGACAWPAANRPRWSKMIVVISWRGNDNGQQRFDLMEMRYINPIIIKDKNRFYVLISLIGKLIWKVLTEVHIHILKWSTQNLETHTHTPTSLPPPHTPQQTHTHPNNSHSPPTHIHTHYSWFCDHLRSQ